MGKWLQGLGLLGGVSDLMRETWEPVHTSPPLQKTQKVVSVWNRSPPDTKSPGVPSSSGMGSQMFLLFITLL